MYYAIFCPTLNKDFNNNNNNNNQVWIYNPAVKTGLSKKLCSLCHGPIRLVDQVNPVSSKVTNLQGKLQKGSVHVNQMEQYT